MDQRRFPRYKVAQLKQLRAKIDRHNSKEQIVTLAKGGCGFYGLEPNDSLIENRRVYPVIELENAKESPLELQGTIVFRRDAKINGRTVYYYGIKFVPTFEDRIEPMIRQLEKLVETGEVQIDTFEA